MLPIRLRLHAVDQLGAHSERLGLCPRCSTALRRPVSSPCFPFRVALSVLRTSVAYGPQAEELLLG